MSDNLKILDADGLETNLRTTELGGFHSPHHILETLPMPSDGTDTVEIMTGPVNSEKGMRVFIGPTDPVSDLPVIVDFEHHQVHEGETYKALHVGAAASGTVEYSFVVGAHTPAIRSPHLILGFDVYDGAISVALYEAPTGTPTGTPMTAQNRNRNSTNVATAAAKHTVTGLSAGTLLDNFYVGADNSSSTDRATSEWLLKVNTTYRIVVTVLVSANWTAHFDWYEDLGV